MELTTDQVPVTDIDEKIMLRLMDNDHIIKDWFWVKTPIPVVSTLVLYLLIVLRLGPRFMAKRCPYDLNNVMRVYNVFQVLHNGYMLGCLIIYPRVLPILIKSSCAVIEDTDYGELKVAYMFYSWNYFVSKMLDLLDTVFMVLRKKDSHVTFLHVYHHVAMVFFVWFTFTYTKSHHAVIPGLINAFIHTLMYSYYFLATFPQLKKYLWWKKHLTTLQLIQFGIILGYISLLYYNKCPMCPIFTCIWLFNVFVILVLFINFYIRSYVLKSSRSNREKSS